MNKPVLVIMAAGMGSRYGGLKQIDTVDDENDKIIDFSIFDAKRAGFEKVIFIIKRENHELFKEAIGDAVARHIEVEYVFQELSDIPEGEKLYENRTKPYGTAHAVRSVRNVVQGPFAVINADDFYGREAFQKIYEYLVSTEGKPGNYCMVGFKLGNTLTENGSVSRGICSVDESGNLIDITERIKIICTENGAAYTENDRDYIPIPTDTMTSMNIWGFNKDFLKEIDDAFVKFYREELPKNIEKAECYLPFVVDGMIKSGRATVKVLSSSDKWFGVTYKEDKEYVREKIAQLKSQGVYPKYLWQS
ncbi:MAG: nucleotidyltransferase [Lachnospiraceae bacterium]|nr:nucleotidyltransferase [Lachnospiraceae bacterium]